MAVMATKSLFMFYVCLNQFFVSSAAKIDIYYKRGRSVLRMPRLFNESVLSESDVSSSALYSIIPV